MSKEQISEDVLIEKAHADGLKEGLEKGRAEAKAEFESLIQAAGAEAVEKIEAVKTAERTRATSVMAAAKGKEAVAEKLLATEMDADAILAVLEVTPAEQAAAPAPVQTGLSQGASVPKSDDESEAHLSEQEKLAGDMASELMANLQAKGLIKGSAK